MKRVWTSNPGDSILHRKRRIRPPVSTFDRWAYGNQYGSYNSDED